jgi:hypothetical protein
MKNDFITLYKAIPSKEQEAFSQYLDCFYANNKAVLNVFDQLAQQNQSLKNIEDNLNTSHKNTLNALADLKKWLLEFLAFQEVRQNNIEAKYLTLEALRKRKLYELLNQKSNLLSQELEQHTSPDMWHLLWQLRVEHINYFHTPHDKLQEHQSKMTRLIVTLDTFYMAAKLKYSAEILSRSQVLQEQYDISPLDEMLILLKSLNPSHSIVHDLYMPMLEMTKNHSEQAYQTLKRFLKERQMHDPIERQAILFYLINAITPRLRTNDPALIQECFDLYELGLAESLFTATGHFPTESFTNIINVGCRLGKYEWLEQFVQQWSGHLIPQDRDDTTNFAMARIFFDERKFDKVIILLNSVTFKNFLISLNGRTLLIRAYYEMKVENKYLLIDSLNALYLYVFRNKSIGSNLKTNVLNFIKIFRLLIHDKTTQNSILKELEKRQTMIICYDWLLSKAKERFIR